MRIGPWRYCHYAIVALFGLAQAAAPAAAQAPPAPDARFEAAKAAFEGLAADARKAVQDALVWTGDYAGTVDGTFGKRTFDGIVAFETKGKHKADGIVDDKERAVLEAAARKARQAVDFRAFADERTGLALSLPGRILGKRTPTKSGMRLESADGGVILETFSHGEETKLADLFEKTRQEGGGRKVAYKVFHTDWFVVAGEEQGRSFYTRIAAGEKGARGYTFAYRTARKAELDRVAVAIANSFEPFPRAQQTAAPTSAGGTEALPELGFSGSGLLVAPGKVLTAASAAGCAEPSIGGQKARIAGRDEAAGLALLEAAATAGGGAVRLAGKAPASHDGLLVVGISALAGSPSVGAAPGEAALVDDRLRVLAGLQRGAAGSVVLDRTGALVGIVAGGGPEPRLVAGIVPQASHPVIGAAAIGAFLSGAGVVLATGTDATARSTGEIASTAAPAIVAVSCPGSAKP